MSSKTPKGEQTPEAPPLIPEDVYVTAQSLAGQQIPDWLDQYGAFFPDGTSIGEHLNKPIPPDGMGEPEDDEEESLVEEALATAVAIGRSDVIDEIVTTAKKIAGRAQGRLPVWAHTAGRLGWIGAFATIGATIWNMTKEEYDEQVNTAIAAVDADIAEAINLPIEEVTVTATQLASAVDPYGNTIDQAAFMALVGATPQQMEEVLVQAQDLSRQEKTVIALPLNWVTGYQAPAMDRHPISTPYPDVQLYPANAGYNAPTEYTGARDKIATTSATTANIDFWNDAGVLPPVTVGWQIANGTTTLSTSMAKTYDAVNYENQPREDLKNSSAAQSLRAVYAWKSKTFGTFTEILDTLGVLRNNITFDNKRFVGTHEDFIKAFYHLYKDDPDRINVDMDQFLMDMYMMEVMDMMIGQMMGRYAKWQQEMGIWLPASWIQQWFQHHGYPE